MEHITVTRKDGSTTYVLNDHGTMVSSAKQIRSLLEEDYVDIELVSVSVPNVKLGDYIDVYGRRYTVNQLPSVEKKGSRNHMVKIRFEGDQYTMSRVAYMLSGDTTSLSLQDVRGNSLIGDIGVFLDVMVANLNRVFPGEWETGVYPSGTAADTLITFDDDDNCLSVLQTLCDVFDSEFDITTSNGVNYINIRERNVVFPYSFKYGKMNGLYELSRGNSDSDNIINKMYVYGGTKNLTQNYLCDRLVLRNKTKSTSFIKDDTQIALNGVFEGVKVYDDIYPEREGTLTSIDTANRLKVADSSMFDLNEKWQDTTSDYAWWLSLKGLTDTTEHHTVYQDSVVNSTKYLMAGTSAKLHFNSGNLAGYDFEVSSYDHATHTITLKRQTDERGLEIPNDDDAAFQAGVGDKYTLTDIMLPQSYITAAQQRLSAAAQADFDKVCVPRVKYELKIDELYIQEHCPNDVVAIDCGDYVTLTDADFVGSSTNVRVRRVERNLLSRYEYVLELEDVGVFRERRRISRKEVIRQRVSGNVFQFQPTNSISDITNDVDFHGNELVNAVVEKRTTDPATPSEGQIYYNTTAKKTKQYDGTSWKDMVATYNFGVCSTTQSTQIKQVSIPSVTELYPGLAVTVKFTYKNVQLNPKLKINNLDAVDMMQYGTTRFSTTDETNGWYAGSVLTFVYDGTNFVLAGKTNTNTVNYYNNTSFMNVYGVCHSTKWDTDKSVTLPSGGSIYLEANGYLTVHFDNAVNTGSSMHVSNGGSFPIYHGGNPIKAGTIEDGDTALFILTRAIQDGAWVLLAVDRAQKSTIVYFIAAGYKPGITPPVSHFSDYLFMPMTYSDSFTYDTVIALGDMVALKEQGRLGCVMIGTQANDTSFAELIGKGNNAFFVFRNFENSMVKTYSLTPYHHESVEEGYWEVKKL